VALNTIKQTNNRIVIYVEIEIKCVVT